MTRKKPEVESGLAPEKWPATTEALADLLAPLPPDRNEKALELLDVLADRCRYGGSVGLADLRSVIAILRGG